MAENPPAEGRDSLTFEKALEELEAIVARMEDGKLPLDESLAAYQRGAELIKFCESKLNAAQARIAILEGGELRDLPRGGETPPDRER
jgi:exodeoxyribonuclease VII small subunit